MTSINTDAKNLPLCIYLLDNFGHVHTFSLRFFSDPQKFSTIAYRLGMRCVDTLSSRVIDFCINYSSHKSLESVISFSIIGFYENRPFSFQ